MKIPNSIVLFFTLFIFDNLFSAELKRIDFYQKENTSKVEFNFSSALVKASRFHVIDDKQIIVDIENVKSSAKVVRAIDTSEFSGAVVFISPYRKPENKKDLRVAIQLRDNVRSILSFSGKKLVLTIENRFGVFTQNQVERAEKNAEVIGSGEALSKIKVAKSESIEDILENLTQSGTKKYIGKRISLNVKELKVPDILTMIANSSGFNIILDDDVQKARPLTLSLTNIPWDQALDTVLSLSKLVAQKNGNILMITTLSKATNQRKLELENEKLSQRQESLVTRIFPISFALISDLVKILSEYVTPQRGKISFDTRTNAVIVKDTIDAIEKIRKIIEVLDTQTPQILIESKIVEVTEAHNMTLGFQRGLVFGYDPFTTPPDDPSGQGFAFSSAPVEGDAGTTNVFGFGITAYRRLVNLDFQLQLMEQESKGKIVSSPRIITQNNKAASIINTEAKSFKTSITNDGNVTESFSTVSVNLSLNVTPKVTNEGSITMDVSLSKGGFSARTSESIPPDVNTRTLQTTVLVDNGSTVVIGGIYTFASTESHSGIPFLKDLPLLGWFFRTPYNPSEQKNELIIFLTPRIINQEEAGLVDRDKV